MISSSREEGFQTKQEGEGIDQRFFKGPSSSSSRQWSGFRNPRIVRVSRSFGGKDRHSKVCTIRGLRDRRIRLSVPTAIQLYDLQERLGLSQPSKVIDWLLDVTKHDIDKLPPLPIPQGFGHQFQHQSTLLSHDQSNASQSPLAPFFHISGGFHPLTSIKEGIKINNSVGEADPAMMGSQSKYCWDVDSSSSSLRAKGKEVERENIFEKGKWIKKITEQKDNQDGTSGTHCTEQASAQKFFPLANHPSLSGLPNTAAMPFNSSSYHWEPSNLSLSQFGSHEFLSQTENSLYSNAVSLPSSLAFPSGPHLFFCPPATMPSFFSAYSPYVSATAESESRQINHFQLMSSTSQHIVPNSVAINSQVKPFSLNVNPGLAQTRINVESHHQHKEDA